MRDFLALFSSFADLFSFLIHGISRLLSYFVLVTLVIAILVNLFFFVSRHLKSFFFRFCRKE